MYTYLLFIINICLFYKTLYIDNTFLYNLLISYISFTIMHEASHNLISSNIYINDVIGTISSIFVSPLSSYYGFKYIHKNHHKYVNTKKDPDYWISHNKKTILKCIFQLPYYYYYLSKLYFENKISIKTQIKNLFQIYISIICLVIFYIFDCHNILNIYFYKLFIPSLISIPLLSYLLVYIPHCNITNSNRTSHEIHCKYIPDHILSILMLNQNKHEIHHKKPFLKFFNY